MFDNFELDGCKLLKEAERERYQLRHPYVGSEHLLLGILKNSSEVSSLFEKHQITYEIFKTELIKIVGKSTKICELNLYTPLLKRIIAGALEDAKENNDGKVLPKHYILSMLEEGEGIALRMLLSLNVNLDKLHNDLKKNSLGAKDLNKIGTNLNECVDKTEKIIGRDKEINQIIEVLIRKNKNNPLLVGEAGVGKTAIIEELARRIPLKRVPKIMLDKQIIMIEMGNLVAGTKYRGEFEEKMSKLIEEAKNNKEIILFIDEIHTIVNAGGAEGAVNAADILKPHLARGGIRCIGATTSQEYDRFITKDKALERRFEVINVSEPNEDELKDLLYKIKPEYEKYYNISLNKKNIDDIIEISDLYIHNKFNPDKTIELLDTVCASIKLKNDSLNQNIDINAIVKLKEDAIKNNQFEEAFKYREVEETAKKNIHNLKCKMQKKDIISAISCKYGVPTGIDFNQANYQLKNQLRKQLLGYNEVFETINLTLKNYYSKKEKKPLSLLFKGKSIMDKKETAKIISSYFLKYNKPILIDLKELRNESFLNKFIGISSGYVGYGEDYLLKPLTKNTFNVIIMDNYDNIDENLSNFINKLVTRPKIMSNSGDWIITSNTLFIIIDNEKNHNAIGFSNELSMKLEENNFTKTIDFEYEKSFEIKKEIQQKIPIL